MIINDKRAKLKVGQYLGETYEKRQIVLHHTVGSGNPFNVVHGWNSNVDRIGTSIIIAGNLDSTHSYKDGGIYETFPINQFAFHLGVKAKNRLELERNSIGIEICNYGQLIFKDRNFYALNGFLMIPKSQVCDIGQVWRGSRYYHAYTDRQIEALRELLLELSKTYDIPLDYNSIFEVSNLALKGKEGIWSHSNFRLDKSDVSPQPNLIKMLKSLKQYAT